ncbi:MAG: STAS domain-containing protein [Streptosporangiaceae bacterium]
MTNREDTVRWYGRQVIVTLPAEIDVTNSAQVDDLLAAVSAQGPEILTVDMTGTNFCDSSGIHALARAHRLTGANGGELRIAIGTSPTLRVLQLTGLDQVLTVFSDVDQARSAPRTPAQRA